MIERDEQLRDAITNGFSKANVDARNLAVEVVDGAIIVKGTVSSQHALEKVRHILSEVPFGARSAHCQIGVVSTAPSDSLDGRGRSPLTGTSADSAHESRHQLDKK